MPIYTVQKADDPDGESWDINCSYEELKQVLEEYNLVRVLVPPKFASSDGRGNLSKAGSNWRDLLGKIKKGSGRGNTIKT